MPADHGPCDWQVIPSGMKWSMASCLRLSEWDLPLMLEVRVMSQFLQRMRLIWILVLKVGLKFSTYMSPAIQHDRLTVRREDLLRRPHLSQPSRNALWVAA